MTLALLLGEPLESASVLLPLFVAVTAACLFVADRFYVFQHAPASPAVGQVVVASVAFAFAGLAILNVLPAVDAMVWFFVATAGLFGGIGVYVAMRYRDA